MKKKLTIGFIGQGFIGKNYADDFEKREYKVIRYSLDGEYKNNDKHIKECDIVFIAVPTPTTPRGFDYSVIESVLPLIGKGKIAVIKSTILPGTIEKLQKRFSSIFILNSPEFLREVSASKDASHPERNIIGIPIDDKEFNKKAKIVLDVLPKAPYEIITSSVNAECVKYIGNCFLYTKLLFMNLAYDFSLAQGGDWEKIKEMVSNDSRIGKSHMNVNNSGRGSGGYCFPKDFEAFLRMYGKTVKDKKGLKALEALRDKNNSLLISTKKDLDILKGIYGKL